MVGAVIQFCFELGAARTHRAIIALIMKEHGLQEALLNKQLSMKVAADDMEAIDDILRQLTYTNRVQGSGGPQYCHIPQKHFGFTIQKYLDCPVNSEP